MRWLLILPLSALLLGCSASRYDVRTDADPEVDLAALKTFAVPPRDRPDTPNVLDNSLVLKRITALVVKHLEQRGLKRVALDASPDLALRLWVTTQEKTDVSTIPTMMPLWEPWPAPYPYDYGRWGPMYNDVIVRNYVEGTLVVDLVDAKSKELVWRAYVVGTVNRDREQGYALLDEALGRAFAALPR